MSTRIRLSAIRITGAAVVWLLASYMAAQVDPAAYAGGRARDEQERIRRNSSALAAMLGEFRTSISDIMFVKAEQYFHGGVAYLPHHAESALSAEDLADEVDEHQSELTPSRRVRTETAAALAGDGDHAGTATLIPSPERDFRGVVGDLYRQVRPWRHPDKPHFHTDGRDLVPWFRLMTLIDPYYVRGYVAGGFWLAWDDPEAAIRFIEEGLANNPDAFQLYVARGFLRIRSIRASYPIVIDALRYPQQRELVRLAQLDFRKGAELGLQIRPRNGEDSIPGSISWGTYLENDVFIACRMDIYLTGELDNQGAARQRAERYAAHFPELIL